MRWSVKQKSPAKIVEHLMQELRVESLVAELLAQRGITNFEEARKFFRPSLDDLHDPYLMKDMDKAVLRLEAAFEKGERILVFGDYDVDGTTSVALLSSYLKTIYSEVDTYIPDRYTEGYGISTAGIDYAEDNGISLIVALDCGIKAVDKVEYAKAKGIDFIICDHHLPGEILPDAVAILDAKQKDCNYPYDELCGCGVGFKLVQALAGKRGQTIEDLKPYLDIVATAIGADIVPITGENRVLAFFGLEVINSNPRVGIKALLKEYNQPNFTITDIVFKVAPKINAAGRIKHGNYAVALLTKFTEKEADSAAVEIKEFNSVRKELDEEITNIALKQIYENDEVDRKTTVVFNPEWHKGVIGIVASRLIEKYYRPTLVFTKSGDKLAASARSVKKFDVYKALEACSEYIEQFGGHMYAAGLTLEESNYQKFKDKFEEVVSQTITEEQLVESIEIDAEIDFGQYSAKTLRILKQFEPHGPENMKPVFLTKNVFDTGYAKAIGKNNDHLKLFVKQAPSNELSKGISAIGFGLGAFCDNLKNSKHFDMVYTLEENHWNEETTTQLQVRDIHL